ncbi:YidC/Oxa1 family membrane protein insertase, partial [Fusobacterium mortiferum]|nr:membrane protein insertase YidC [Fusobacterium mortiferum]
IILATIVIKIILLPLTLKQDKSMKSMKVLQPEIEKIKQQYQNDPKMMNQKTMELYQKHKVNPMGGCLPLLVQLPILWALFGVLRDTATVPQDSTFLWMQLINPDPYYVLPVLNGVVSFLQQKVMGSSDNPQMKNMMYIFPLMMVFISYKMPAGLQIYWLASSVSAVVQQYLIMKKGD